MSSASVLKECLFSALIHWFWSIIGFDFGALVYWFWSIGFGAYAVTRTKKKSVLKECLCCGEVKLPGEYKARPFLQASEMKLLELIGQNSVFDIEKPFVFPEVIIRAGDQEQNGFEAEYRVYEELKKSNLHMYVFYSLKTKKNEELVDFLLVSKSSVIILEVKSFKLVDNPTVKDYETLRKKLSDNKKRQEERVKRNIKEFMSNHGCENNVDLFLYFNLFQNTKRSQLPKDTDWLPKNVLFKDDYLKVIEDIINSPKKVDENGEYTMRIFLSWLYGLHISYLKTKYQWDILKPGQIVKKQIDEEYRKKKKKDERMNKGVADVFLTPTQKAIVECDHPFLQIIGLPGTGKTYCLILKMVNVFFELWQLYRNEPHRTNELIIVFHRNEKTLHWIRGMFWQTLEKQIERQNNNKKEITCLEEIPKLIKFIGGSNVIDIETQQVFRVDFGTNFKVFCDDLNWDFATFDTKSRNFEIQDVIARSNFWWLTSYSEIPALYVNSRTTNKTFDSYHSVYLTDSLRYTGSIYSLLKQLCGIDPMRHGWISGMDFNPGTRVIGEKPQFICVRDCNAMKDKVHMLLQKLKEEGIRRDEIAVIKTGVSKNIIKHILQEDYITKHLLYGLHISYLKTKYQWDILKPGQIVKKQIDEEYRKKKKKDERMNKGVADVFLTPTQKAIVECDHPFLQIIGLPGTGKTYCLILKMVNVFFELWQLYRNEPHRTNELIIVFHRNEKTLHWIRGMFWQTLEKQIERQNNNKKEITCLEEIPKLIKFIGGSNVIDIETQQVFRVEECGFGTNFKVFCDDLNWDFATFDTKSRNFEIQDVIARSNFWWLTSYSEIPALYVNSRTTNKTFDSYHSVYLTDSLRYTGSIYSLLKQLCGIDPMRHGWISGMDFNPGTRVIGEKPQFICVRDCNAMKDKVHMLLQKLKEEGIRRDEIAVIKTGVSKNIIKHILQEDYITKHLSHSSRSSRSSSASSRSSRSSSSSSTTSRSSSVTSTTSSSSASSAEGVYVKKDRRAGEVDFQSEASNLMSALGIGDDNLDIKDAHSVSFVHESDSQMNFSLRGMEFYHVIVCVTQMQNSFSDKKRLAAIKEGLRNKEFSQTLNCIQQIQDKSKKGWETFITHDLVEAISRAVVGATIVYMEGDSFLSKIAEEFKSVSPEISQNNTCNKEYKVEQFIREYDSLSCSKSAPRVLRYQQKMRSGNYVLEVVGKTIEFTKAFKVDKIIEKKKKKRRN
ncbi:uncharacterized protein LOC136040129 isoform X2 [Artemia franciscana]|uniref:uncharacterized protein LOC136040129 isoform X2 n=1 Tax=Artemia franciscana TaxID=6661 RepID=UPI0032DA2016